MALLSKFCEVLLAPYKCCECKSRSNFSSGSEIEEILPMNTCTLFRKDYQMVSGHKFDDVLLHRMYKCGCYQTGSIYLSGCWTCKAVTPVTCIATSVYRTFSPSDIFPGHFTLPHNSPFFLRSVGRFSPSTTVHPPIYMPLTPTVPRLGVLTLTDPRRPVLTLAVTLTLTDLHGGQLSEYWH